MDYKTITVETKDNISVITLNRPPANSINMEMREDLDRALTELEQNKESRVVMVTGAGDKGFCAGMDVMDVANLYKGPDPNDLLFRFDCFPKPIVAALNGYCLGGGLELAVACHFRLMTDNPKAKIGYPEVNLGITPGWGGIQRTARLLGRPKALEMILLSQRLSAQEALAIGLVDKVFPDADFRKEALAFAAAFSKKAPIAVSAVLNGMTVGMEKGIVEGINTDRQWTKKLAQSKDAQEGMIAYMQKRDPVFTGE